MRSDGVETNYGVVHELNYKLSSLTTAKYAI